MSHVKRNCGCETRHNGDGNWFIEFCQLHVAAPELLKACKFAKQNITLNGRVLDDTVYDILKTVIAVAEEK